MGHYCQSGRDEVTNHRTTLLTALSYMKEDVFETRRLPQGVLFSRPRKILDFQCGNPKSNVKWKSRGHGNTPSGILRFQVPSSPIL